MTSPRICRRCSSRTSTTAPGSIRRRCPIRTTTSPAAPGRAWPGRDQFSGAIAQSWNQRYFPEWSVWKPLTDYWARGDLVLRSGRAREDVVIYRDAPTTFQNTLADQGYSNANYQVDPQS